MKANVDDIYNIFPTINTHRRHQANKLSAASNAPTLSLWAIICWTKLMLPFCRCGQTLFTCSAWHACKRDSVRVGGILKIEIYSFIYYKILKWTYFNSSDCAFRLEMEYQIDSSGWKSLAKCPQSIKCWR